jgi:hypothetical protein
MRAVDRENMVVIGDAAVAGDDPGVGRCGKSRKEEEY